VVITHVYDNETPFNYEISASYSLAGRETVKE